MEPKNFKTKIIIAHYGAVVRYFYVSSWERCFKVLVELFQRIWTAARPVDDEAADQIGKSKEYWVGATANTPKTTMLLTECGVKRKSFCTQCS